MQTHYGLDADATIDYWESDKTVLARMREHLGCIHIITLTIAEVRGATQTQFEQMGFVIEDPTSADVRIADSARSQRWPGLSREDGLLTHLAQREGWIVISNDRRLRAACQTEGVPLLWGLEPLALLGEAGALQLSEAKRIAQTIHTNNERITDEILGRFLARLGF